MPMPQPMQSAAMIGVGFVVITSLTTLYALLA